MLRRFRYLISLSLLPFSLVAHQVSVSDEISESDERWGVMLEFEEVSPYRFAQQGADVV